MGTDGHVASQGSVSDALAVDSKLAEEVQHEEEALELDEHEEDVGGATGEVQGKLIVAEEVEEGHVSKSACKSGLDKLSKSIGC